MYKSPETQWTLYYYHYYHDYSFQLFLLVVLLFLVSTSLPHFHQGFVMFLNRAAKEIILLHKIIDTNGEFQI